MANAADADFYGLEQLLDDTGRDALQRTREFMAKEIEPVINHYWTREEFPHDLIPAFARLGIAGTAYEGYGCPGGGPLLDGVIAMELARTDPSISTFMGVHSGLAMGSIYLCGSEEQKQRWLPEMARMEKIGAFGLTEPDVGSGVAGGLTTTARRDGAGWVLDGQKKWIGNATFADYVVIWARDAEDGQVKGFVVEQGTPGFSAMKKRDKIALRVVQNAHITLDGLRVPETNRLQKADSFRETAKVLRLTRAGVAWQAVGCARGAYEHALAYVKEREQFGKPIAASSSCRTCSCGCWPISPPRPACAPGWPSCRRRARRPTSTPPWPRRSARCVCGKPSAAPAICSAVTASCWRTRSAGSSPTPRRSTPTRAPVRSTPSSSAGPSPA
jgi:glutaryl-CoA dehydrogenase